MTDSEGLCFVGTVLLALLLFALALPRESAPAETAYRCAGEICLGWAR